MQSARLGQVATAVPDIGNQLTAEQGLTDMQSSAVDDKCAADR